jgi:hypothetical protein
MRESGESCGFSPFRIEESLGWALFHASSQTEVLAIRVRGCPSRQLRHVIDIISFLNDAMAESLQQLILDTLDAHSTIQDTRSLTIPDQTQPATSHEDQNTILGALNSLLSRDVRPDLVINHIP